VFATAEIAGDAQRLRVSVDDDHGVDAILFALAAVVFNRLPGAILA